MSCFPFLQLYHIQCEQKFLTSIASRDSQGRTVLHYAASAQGTSVQAIMRYQDNRFRNATTAEIVHPVVQLFPSDAWVSPVTGDMWRPARSGAAYFAAEDQDPEFPPEGYVSVAELQRARCDPSFID